MNIVLSDNEFDLIVTSLTNRKSQHINIEDLCNIAGHGYYTQTNKQHIITPFFNNIKFSNNVLEKTISFIWGNSKSVDNYNAIDAVLKSNGTLILCEDGFLRSFDTWCSKKYANQMSLIQSCSTIFDSSAYYFDATRPSDIEKLINSDFIVSSEQQQYAKKIIDIIVKNKLSKYNHQPIFKPTIGTHAHKVLVVDQSYGDFSIQKGLATDQTFEKMLQCAIKENPDADILVKTHPDTMTGHRSGYYSSLKESNNVYKVTTAINPYSLLDIVDKVYVCSTQFGFEALMAGKEVHTFGMPFYANWGITIDDQHLARRTKTRSLLELFYMFYCIYTHWYNPITKQACTIEDVIQYLLKLRISQLGY